METFFVKAVVLFAKVNSQSPRSDASSRYTAIRCRMHISPTDPNIDTST